MYEYTCAFCGKVVQVRWPSQVQKFCSKSCSAGYGNKLRAGKDPINGSCIYQPESIMCDRRICSRCGWNPEVAHARLEAITGVSADQGNEE